MAFDQPYMYDRDRNRSGRFPERPFDPKAITRASWEVQPSRAKSKGPLIWLDCHLDSVPVVVDHQTSRRSRFVGPSTTAWIKSFRYGLLGLRALQLFGAAGLLAMMILIAKAEELLQWAMRAASGIVILHSAYAVYHILRAVGVRRPGSQAAYHLFAGVLDLLVLLVFAYAYREARQRSSEWAILLHDQTMLQYLVPAFGWSLVTASCLHAVTLLISAGLATIFQLVTKKSPDRNPLQTKTSVSTRERNKSSTSVSEEEFPRRSLPCSHGRRLDLPSRQYQIQPRNSHRSSHDTNTQCRSSPPPPPPPRHAYVEIPTHEPAAEAAASQSRTSVDVDITTWFASDSLHRQHAYASKRQAYETYQSYDALRQRAIDKTAPFHSRSDSESDYGHDRVDDDDDDDEDVDEGDKDDGDGHDGDRYTVAVGASSHINPLQSNPSYWLGAGDGGQGKVQTSRPDRCPWTPPSPLSSVEADKFVFIRAGLGCDVPLRAASTAVFGANRQVSSGNDYPLPFEATGRGRRIVSGKMA